MIYRNELGELHREDGPAIESEKGKSWFKNNKRHNANGPAVINEWGHQEYWLEGVHYDNRETWIKVVRKYKLEKLLQ